MKWDFKIVVILVEWSSFRGGLKAGFYCIYNTAGRKDSTEAILFHQYNKTEGEIKIFLYISL